MRSMNITLSTPLIPGAVDSVETSTLSVQADCCSGDDCALDCGSETDETRARLLLDDARLFRALGDATRLAIIEQLSEQGDVCACDFAACCTVAQPTVSHHLKVLRDAGVIVGDKRGLWVHYRLAPGALARLRRYVR